MADDKGQLKNALRRQALSRRDALDDAYRIEASLMAAELGRDAISFDPGTIVSGFFPIRSEIDIRPLMFALREKGARLCLPAIIDKETILFRELIRGAEMIEMGFGTVGPGPEAEVLEPDILLMPLAAFDESGNRVGYGGGFYDRAIARLHELDQQPQLIGCAFDCQSADAIPAEAHDVPLDAIITESGLHSFAKR